MANMDESGRGGYERTTLSDSGAQIRRGSEKGAAIYSIIAIVIGGVLCYAALEAMKGWAQWLVFGVLLAFTIALAFAVGPNRAGAGSSQSADSL